MNKKLCWLLSIVIILSSFSFNNIFAATALQVNNVIITNGVTEYTNITSNQNVYITASIQGTGTGKAIFAIYDKSGLLLKVGIANYSSSGNVSIPYTVTSSFNESVVKVFVVKDLANIQPQSNIGVCNFSDYVNPTTPFVAKSITEDFQNIAVGTKWVEYSNSPLVPGVKDLNADGTTGNTNRFFGITNTFAVTDFGLNTRTAKKTFTTALDGDFIELSMDLFLVGNELTDGCINTFDVLSSDGRTVLTLSWNNTSSSSRYGVYLENSITKIGTITDELSNWVTFKALVNFKTKKVEYASMRKIGSAINDSYVAVDASFIDKEATDIKSLLISMVRGGGSSRGAFFIDNINMKRVEAKAVNSITGETNLEVPLLYENKYNYSTSALFDVSTKPANADFIWSVYSKEGKPTQGLNIINNIDKNLSSNVQLSVDTTAQAGTYYLKARLANSPKTFTEIPITVAKVPDLPLKPMQLPSSATTNYVENFDKIAVGDKWSATSNYSYFGVFDIGDGDRVFGIPNSLSTASFGRTPTTLTKTLPTSVSNDYSILDFDLWLAGNELNANVDTFSLQSSTGKDVLKFAFCKTTKSSKNGLWLENGTSTKLFPNEDLSNWFNIKAFVDNKGKQLKYLSVTRKDTGTNYYAKNIPFVDASAENIGKISLLIENTMGTGGYAKGGLALNNISITNAQPDSFTIDGTPEIGIYPDKTVGYSYNVSAKYAQSDEALPMNITWSLLDSNGNAPKGMTIHNKRNSNDIVLLVSPTASSGSFKLRAQLPNDFTKYSDYDITIQPSPLPQAPQQPNGSTTARQMEYIDRGLVATKTSELQNYISWRSLGNESLDTIGYNIYRQDIKINTSPIISKTNFIDNYGLETSTYTVKVVQNVNGKWLERDESAPSTTLLNPYIDIFVDVPKKSYRSATYSMSEASTADLDGDGEYEIIVQWSPSDSKDPTNSGATSETYYDAYKLDGTKLWRINLGKNIRAGAHYTQFLAYDFDGDGKAELAMRTANGTFDGLGNPVGDPNDTTNYSTLDARCQIAPDYLTVFRGTDGKQLASIPYFAPSGAVMKDVVDATTGAVTKTLDTSDVSAQWGDTNRADRFLAAVAYVNGKTPSIVMCRGYYAKTAVAAFDFKNNTITKVWEINSSEPSKNVGGKDFSKLAGQGNHNLSVGDVDSDGCDEIMYGGAGINNDGTLMYYGAYGHADSIHLADHIPSRPGLEVVIGHEDKPCLEMHDARTGEILAYQKAASDVGRSMGEDVDPTYEGSEIWATSGTGTGTPDYIMGSTNAGLAQNGGFYRGTDGVFKEYPLSFWVMPNFATYWDGDLVREASNGGGTAGFRVYKYNPASKTTSLLTTLGEGNKYTSTNSTKAVPLLQADLFGDWREEVILPATIDDRIRIFMTTIPTDYRIPTLMHDPIYRLGIAWQNIGYNQPPHLGYYLGGGTYIKPKTNNWYFPKSN